MRSYVILHPFPYRSDRKEYVQIRVLQILQIVTSCKSLKSIFVPNSGQNYLYVPVTIHIYLLP